MGVDMGSFPCEGSAKIPLLPNADPLVIASAILPRDPILDAESTTPMNFSAICRLASITSSWRGCAGSFSASIISSTVISSTVSTRSGSSASTGCDGVSSSTLSLSIGSAGSGVSLLTVLMFLRLTRLFLVSDDLGKFFQSLGDTVERPRWRIRCVEKLVQVNDVRQGLHRPKGAFARDRNRVNTRETPTENLVSHIDSPL